MELLFEILFKSNFLNPHDIAGSWTKRNAVQQMICVLHNRYRQRKREFGLKTRDGKRPCGRAPAEAGAYRSQSSFSVSRPVAKLSIWTSSVRSSSSSAPK